MPHRSVYPYPSWPKPKLLRHPHQSNIIREAFGDSGDIADAEVDLPRGTGTPGAGRRRPEIRQAGHIWEKAGIDAWVATAVMKQRLQLVGRGQAPVVGAAQADGVDRRNELLGIAAGDHRAAARATRCGAGAAAVGVRIGAVPSVGPVLVVQ